MLAFLLILIIFLFFLRQYKRGIRSEFRLGSSVKQLLTGAGAIYLSLDATLKFLGIKIPEKIVIGDVALKPLPAVSLLLALLEPVGEGIVNALRRACRQRNN
ncbi:MULTISPECIES: hypothetical protein [Carboxydothermus]|uniref:Uncharacterized protein n=2 Tax=Carboxydothermus TaxID=129957 RepID=Q3ACZ0_CARHZ|nr:MULTISPECIES: hypothetical protein [Carboxydothermus]ABB15002.1 hypothetical protein CHY_1149 [Carboxydothermus hydrogenoformans Z-2901]NYE57054.1 hypothetical protein [Carboxydothermus ferrireducens DSM 11255]